MNVEVKEGSMKASRIFGLLFAVAFVAGPVAAQQALVIKPLAEKKVSKLPEGKLFWRIETFDTEEQAKAAASPTALVAQTAGKVWLFTLGAAGGTPVGTKVAEIGPLPDVAASEYLLRINEAGGPKGSITPVHTHPGSETFYVIKGETSQKTPDGVHRVKTGTSMVGHGSDTPMQVSSTGADDLHSLVMFVVDASKPFSTPAKMD
jgi:quercetin dioxygenase-like cupin family protein